MRIHVLQHVPFENEGEIGSWAGERGHSLSRSLLFEGRTPPDPKDYDMLVVMGGPMNIYEHDDHPWLAAEKEHIGLAVARNRHVLGICLGAQLICDVVGGKVTRNPQPEIGWFPVRLTMDARTFPAFASLPDEFTAFHWHGDTFSIPRGAFRLAESEACENQAFAFGQNVLALQFHPETSRRGMAALIENCADEIVTAPHVQSSRRMAEIGGELEAMRPLLFSILDGFTE